MLTAPFTKRPPAPTDRPTAHPLDIDLNGGICSFHTHTHQLDSPSLKSFAAWPLRRLIRTHCYSESTSTLEGFEGVLGFTVANMHTCAVSINGAIPAA